ncbi:MAG: hypothetical protein ACYTAO_14180, partial [Planctomycetota bacterium]
MAESCENCPTKTQFVAKGVEMAVASEIDAGSRAVPGFVRFSRLLVRVVARDTTHKLDASKAGEAAEPADAIARINRPLPQFSGAFL